MKKASLVVAFLSIFLVLTSPAGAVITNWNCAADGDGAIVMAGTPGWQYTGLEGGIATYTMTMDGAQYSGPAHVLGDFITDTETDPIVYIMEDVDNATGFTWTGYEFEVFMSKPFTITGVMAPMGWTYTVGPILGGQTWPHNPLVTGWMGVVTYTANPGSEIANGDMGTFGVRVKFDGTVAFCTQQTPIPEPMTVAMLGLGGLLLKRKK